MRQFQKKYMTIFREFAGTRMRKGRALPTRWSLTLNVGAISGNDDFEPAHNALLYWFDQAFNDAVVVSTEDKVGMGVALAVNNPIIMLPYTDADSIFTQAMHQKLKAILQLSMVVGEIKLMSNTNYGIAYTYDASDDDSVLPRTASEFMGHETVHAMPWWTRNDFTTREYRVGEQVTDPMHGYTGTTEDTQCKQPAQIVKVPNWVPKRV